MSVPLHPAVAHLPLGVAFLAPVLIAIILVATRRGTLHPRAWWVVVAIQAVLLVASFVTLRLGHREEERVEAIVPESAIETHEERATVFAWATAGLLLSAVATALSSGRPRVAGPLSAVTIVGALAVAGLGAWVGHSGGRLVYTHGAAAAYTGDAGRTPAVGARGHAEDDH